MITKIIAISLIFAIILFYLKNTNSEIFIPLLIICSIYITTISLGYFLQYVELFNKIKLLSGINEDIFKIIFKIVAISYLIEFSSGIISDMGLISLAEKVVFAGKIIVLSLALPIINQILTLLVSLL